MDRVRRIADGELRWAKPLGRRHLALMGSLAVVLVGGAASVRFVGFLSPAKGAAVQATPPGRHHTPRPGQESWRSAWEKLDDGLLEVQFDETRNLNWRPAAAPKGEQDEQAAPHFSWPSSICTSGATLAGGVRFDDAEQNPKGLDPDRWSTGFDGEKHFDWQIDQMYGLVVLGEIHKGEQWTPRQLFSHQGDSLIEFLERYEPDRYPYVISQRVVDEMPCYVLKGGKEGGDFGNEIVIAPLRDICAFGRTRHIKAGNRSASISTKFGR